MSSRGAPVGAEGPGQLPPLPPLNPDLPRVGLLRHCALLFVHWGHRVYCMAPIEYTTVRVFLRRFRDPIRVPRIKEIGSLQIYTAYLTFSLKKTATVLHIGRVHARQVEKSFDFMCSVWMNTFCHTVRCILIANTIATNIECIVSFNVSAESLSHHQEYFYISIYLYSWWWLTTKLKHWVI